MHEQAIKARKNIPIGADLHHRLDMYAASSKQTIREVTEQAIVEHLDRLEGSSRSGRQAGRHKSLSEAVVLGEKASCIK